MLLHVYSGMLLFAWGLARFPFLFPTMSLHAPLLIVINSICMQLLLRSCMVHLSIERGGGREEAPLDWGVENYYYNFMALTSTHCYRIETIVDS